MSLHRLDATTLARRIRAREIRPLDAVEAVFAAIDERNQSLLAYCTLTREAALADARELETRLARGTPVGPLAGVPVSIKDLVFTKGVRTTGGSFAYADYVPEEDDIVVARVRAAGAIIIGKTNVAELGYSLTGDNPLFGISRNPWDPRRTSGGSSAGATIAVATGMGPIAIGSDGGGSIRLPAAFCGVFGFKPSMGRVPLWPGCRDERLPGFSSWESIEHIGPITRTVDDAALTMAVIAGSDARDRHSVPDDIDWLRATSRPIAGKRIALALGWGGITVDAELAAATRAAAAVFERELGCIVEEVTPEWGNPVLQFRTLIALETDLEGMKELIGRHGARMSPNIPKLLGIAWTAEQFSNAIKARKAVVNAMSRLMARYDYLFTPTSHVQPPLADRQPGADDVERPIPAMTCIANLTGQPAASIPAGFTAAGLPIGVQIVGKHLADADVLAACAAFERARPWHHRWP